MVLTNYGQAVDVPVAISLIMYFFYAVPEDGDDEVKHKENREDDIDNSHNGSADLDHPNTVFVSIDESIVFCRKILIISVDEAFSKKMPKWIGHQIVQEICDIS